VSKFKGDTLHSDLIVVEQYERPSSVLLGLSSERARDSAQKLRILWKELRRNLVFREFPGLLGVIHPQEFWERS